MDGDRLLCLCVELTNKVVEIHKSVSEKGEKYFCDRLLRSGTEVGLKVFSASKATGFLGCLDRLESALLFVYDTIYWANILFINKYIILDQCCEVRCLCEEIACLLTSKIYLLKSLR